MTQTSICYSLRDLGYLVWVRDLCLPKEWCHVCFLRPLLSCVHVQPICTYSLSKKTTTFSLSHVCSSLCRCHHNSVLPHRTSTSRRQCAASDLAHLQLPSARVCLLPVLCSPFGWWHCWQPSAFGWVLCVNVTVGKKCHG